jgi:hypothetical protein
MTYGSCDDTGCCGKGTNLEVQACLVSANLQDPCLQMEGSAAVCSFSASCLCYNSQGQYVPEGFDGIAQSCADFAGPTRHPNISSLLTGRQGALGLCTRVFGPVNTTATTTMSAAAATSSGSAKRATLSVIGQCNPSSTSSGSSVSPVLPISGMPADVFRDSLPPLLHPQAEEGGEENRRLLPC